MIFIVTIGAFLATFLGGLFALKFRDKLHLIAGFSAGAVLGLTFFDLLPESIELFGGQEGIKTVAMLIAGGFILYLILDRFFFEHSHGDEDCENDHHEHHQKRRGFLGVASLSFHSFLDGLAIGVSFNISSTLGLIVALAVLAHDFSDGINTVNFIIKNGGERRKALKWLLVDSIAPVLGVIVGSFITVSEYSLGILLSIFCGFFLYIGASELLPESYHRHPTWWTTLATIFGFAFLFVIISLAEM